MARLKSIRKRKDGKFIIEKVYDTWDTVIVLKDFIDDYVYEIRNGNVRNDSIEMYKTIIKNEIELPKEEYNEVVDRLVSRITITVEETVFNLEELKEFIKYTMLIDDDVKKIIKNRLRKVIMKEGIKIQNANTVDKLFYMVDIIEIDKNDIINLINWAEEIKYCSLENKKGIIKRLAEYGYEQKAKELAEKSVKSILVDFRYSLNDYIRIGRGYIIDRTIMLSEFIYEIMQLGFDDINKELKQFLDEIWLQKGDKIINMFKRRENKEKHEKALRLIYKLFPKKELLQFVI